MYRISIFTLALTHILFIAACSQETKPKADESTEQVEAPAPLQQEPHRYGGWYCPDNFGFVPVNVQQLDQVPVIADRLPTEQELRDHKSLINIDTEKYPDSRALKMDLPRAATVYSRRTGQGELVIIIQAVVVQQDTVVGYRFANGGNGSARIGDVSFLSEADVAAMGSQPFYYKTLKVNGNTKDIWSAMQQSDYFEDLAVKFNEQQFFATDWNPDLNTELELNKDNERANGFVGMVFGNFYLHIDFVRNGVHYSEKMLISENGEGEPAEIHFASGPYTNDFEAQKSKQDAWLSEVERLINAE